MFPTTKLLYIFGPALIFASIALVIVRNRKQKAGTTKLQQDIAYFKLTSILFGSLLLLLWLMLPSTPVLQSFGYPVDVAAIGNQAKILHLLQTYNQAIVRTAEVMHWFLFLFVWWFLTSLYGVVKAYGDADEQTFAQQPA